MTDQEQLDLNHPNQRRLSALQHCRDPAPPCAECRKVWHGSGTAGRLAVAWLAGLVRSPVDYIHARHFAAAPSLQVNKHGRQRRSRHCPAGTFRLVSSGRRQDPAELPCAGHALGPRPARRNAHHLLQSDPQPAEDLRRDPGARLDGTFEAAVKAGCPDDALVRDAIDALLAVWRTAGERKGELELEPEGPRRARGVPWR